MRTSGVGKKGRKTCSRFSINIGAGFRIRKQFGDHRQKAVPQVINARNRARGGAVSTRKRPPVPDGRRPAREIKSTKTAAARGTARIVLIRDPASWMMTINCRSPPAKPPFPQPTAPFLPVSAEWWSVTTVLFPVLQLPVDACMTSRERSAGCKSSPTQGFISFHLTDRNGRGHGADSPGRGRVLLPPPVCKRG